MKPNKIHLQATLLLSIVSLSMPTAALAAMDIKGALQETLKTNPEILADRSAAKSDEHVIRQAQAGYLPKLDVRVSGGYEHVKNKFKTNSCADGVRCHQDKARANPGVSLVQNVFDGWKTPTDVDRAKAEYIQSEMKVDETQELVAFRAINAFIDVRRFQRLKRLAEQNAAAHQRVLGRVSKLIEGGRASVADRYTVNSRLSDARAAVVDIEGDLNSAIARFKSIVGVEPDRLGSAAIPNEMLPSNVQDAIQTALRNNRTVMLARSSVDVAEAELNATEVPFWPTLSIEADASHNRNNSGRQGYNETATVLGVLRYNIYNGGQDTARIDEIADTVSENRHRLDVALRTAEEETRRSWAERESARLQAADLRKSVSAKDQVKNAFTKQYDLGIRTLLDLLDSENEYFLAKGSLITVDATQDLTEARLLASMGVLLEKFGFHESSPKLLSESEDLACTQTQDSGLIIDTATPQGVTGASTEAYTQDLANSPGIEASAQVVLPTTTENTVTYTPSATVDNNTATSASTTQTATASLETTGDSNSSTQQNYFDSSSSRAVTIGTAEETAQEATPTPIGLSNQQSYYDFDSGQQVIQQTPAATNHYSPSKIKSNQEAEFYDFGENNETQG